MCHSKPNAGALRWPQIDCYSSRMRVVFKILPTWPKNTQYHIKCDKTKTKIWLNLTVFPFRMILGWFQTVFKLISSFFRLILGWFEASFRLVLDWFHILVYFRPFFYFFRFLSLYVEVNLSEAKDHFQLISISFQIQFRSIFVLF